MADISKEDLRKEIAAILKDADLASTSAKKVRQELEEKLDVKLQSRKKEIDDLVMQFVSSKKDGGKKKGKKDDSEEDGGEEDEEEEDEEEEPVQVVNFTYQEMTDMLLVFGRVKGNSEKARRLYGDTFPGRRLPDHTIFDSLYQGLQQYGCFPEIITYYGHPKEVVSKSPKNYMKPKPELAALVGADSMPRCKVVKKGAKKGGGGYIKRFQLSPELSALVGAESMAYHEVVKKVWTIIKEKNLFDPENRQYAICDDSLMKVIGTRRFRTFGMMKYLKNHFIT